MSNLEVEHLQKTSVSGHYRVRREVYDTLEEEARERGISLNALVSSILCTHAQDDLVLQEVGYVKMPKEGMRLNLSLIPDDRLAEFGMLGASRINKAMMAAWGNTLCLDAVLKELHNMSRAGFFSIHEKKENQKRTLIIAHDLGPRGSVVYAAMCRTLFEMVDVHPKVISAESVITLQY